MKPPPTEGSGFQKTVWVIGAVGSLLMIAVALFVLGVIAWAILNA